MSYDRCQKCNGLDCLCTTCGRPRARTYSRRYGDGSHTMLCARRPKGIRPCDEHTAACMVCDYCGRKVEARTLPSDWKYLPRGHACSQCRLDSEVVADAIGGLDMKVVGKAALERLIAALGRIDWAVLTQFERASLSDALDRARESK